MKLNLFSLAMAGMALGTLVVARAATTFPQDISVARPINATFVKSHIASLEGKKPINTLYIRNGTLIGDRLGVLNDTLAKREDDISIGIGSFSIDINLIEVAVATTIFAGLACAFWPGCIAALGSRIAAAGISSASAGPSGAAIEMVTTASSATRMTRKRDGNQYEVWGCEYSGSDESVCSNTDEVAAIGNAIGAYDTPSSSASTSNSASSWSVTSESDGSTVGYYWHCLQDGSDCSLDNNGPGNQDNVGSV